MVPKAYWGEAGMSSTTLNLYKCLQSSCKHMQRRLTGDASAVNGLDGFRLCCQGLLGYDLLYSGIFGQQPSRRLSLPLNIKVQRRAQAISSEGCKENQINPIITHPNNYQQNGSLWYQGGQISQASFCKKHSRTGAFNTAANLYLGFLWRWRIFVLISICFTHVFWLCGKCAVNLVESTWVFMFWICECFWATSTPTLPMSYISAMLAIIISSWIKFRSVL